MISIRNMQEAERLANETYLVQNLAVWTKTIAKALQAKDDQAEKLAEALKAVEDHMIMVMENDGYDRGWYDGDEEISNKVGTALSNYEASKK